jgi:hypothetical protein
MSAERVELSTSTKMSDSEEQVEQSTSVDNSTVHHMSDSEERASQGPETEHQARVDTEEQDLSVGSGRVI